MCDPTDHVRSYEGAIVLAAAMLYPPGGSGARCLSTDEWKTHSEPVLAALLYTASPCQRGGGISWVNNAVTTLAHDIGDSAEAVGIADAEGLRFIRSLDTMDDVQRDSILMTIRDAVTPWLAASRHA